MGDIIELPNILNVNTYDFSLQADLARSILSKVPDCIKKRKFTQDGTNLRVSEIGIISPNGELINNKIDMLNVFQTLTTATNWNVVDYDVKYPSVNKAKRNALKALCLFLIVLTTDLLCGFLIQDRTAVTLSSIFLALPSFILLIGATCEFIDKYGRRNRPNRIYLVIRYNDQSEMLSKQDNIKNLPLYCSVDI